MSLAGLMLCISDALTFIPGSYISPSEDGPRVASGVREDWMKLLGFRVSNQPGVSAHVEALLKRMQQRYWIIKHLRNFGVTKEEFVRVYKTVVRPVTDNCAMVYHSRMTNE